VKGILRGMIFWAEVFPKEGRGSEQVHYGPSPWLVMSADAIHQRFPIVQGVQLTSKHGKEGPPGSPYRQHRIRILASQITHYQVAAPPSGSNPMPPDKNLDPTDQLALTEQARILSHARLLGNPVAQVSPRALFSVEAGLRYVFDLP